MLDLISADGRIDHPLQAAGFVLVAVLAAASLAVAGLNALARDPARTTREFARPEAAFTLAMLVLAVLQIGHARGVPNLFLFRPEVGDGGLVEHLTVALMLLPLGFLAWRLAARRAGRIRLPVALAAAAAGFVLAGEEISWGQHWLGYVPPEVVRETNLQEEFNLHNYIAPTTMEAIYFAAALALLALSANLDALVRSPVRARSLLALKALVALGAVLMAHHVFQEVAELAVILAAAWIYAGLDRGALTLRSRPLAGLALRPA
ncbi:hypothetical protein E5163_08950 [Marinicauda algicola]|uniref:Uncharacterized protein n=1 Tax=Marinicauda algicola TaxID=2029849 RepID=A0A4S2H178_9PROT|nr:hypothetical protein [Marinicauda algicola]TGY89236.1 hypothetical protein E5163_08950 [Marinicauda algicola]